MKGYILILAFDLRLNGCGGSRTRAGRNRGADAVDSMDGGETSPANTEKGPTSHGFSLERLRDVARTTVNSPMHFCWAETARCRCGSRRGGSGSFCEDSTAVCEQQSARGRKRK